MEIEENVTNQGKEENPNLDNDFSIPDEYKDKGWAKFFDGKKGEELKEELFKSYDNSQNLIGKKVQDYILNTDLKNLENFNEIKEALKGQIIEPVEIPQNKEEYALEDMITGDNGEKLLAIEPEALDFFGDKFKEIGLTKEKAQNLFKSYIEFGLDEFQKITNADDLENSIKAMFKESGNTKSQQRQNVESLIREFLPKEDLQIIQDTVPNKVIEMFYKVTKGLVDKYGYQEGARKYNSSSMQMTKEDKDTRYNELVKKLEELDNRPHSADERNNILAQIQKVYE